MNTIKDLTILYTVWNRSFRHFTIGQFGDSLESLTMTNVPLLAEPLAKGVFSHLLKRLEFNGKNFKIESLPSKLEELYISATDISIGNTVSTKNKFPATLRKLQITTEFVESFKDLPLLDTIIFYDEENPKVKLKPGDIPSSVVHLEFPKTKGYEIECGVIHSSVRYLDLGVCKYVFRSETTGVPFFPPDSQEYEYLDLGKGLIIHKIIRVVKPNDLPPKIKELIIGTVSLDLHPFKIEPGSIPYGVKKLTIGLHSSHLGGVIPNTVTDLTIEGNGFIRVLEKGDIPNSVEKLTLLHFRNIIPKDVFPSNIKSIHFIGKNPTSSSSNSNLKLSLSNLPKINHILSEDMYIFKRIDDNRLIGMKVDKEYVTTHIINSSKNKEYLDKCIIV